jgi:hypothetical protein
MPLPKLSDEQVATISAVARKMWENRQAQSAAEGEYEEEPEDEG